MKKKNQEIVFNLKFIDEQAKDNREAFPNVTPKTQTITPLETFPICYFEEVKKEEQIIEETIVHDQPNKFVSPFLGEQKNEY